MSSNIDRYLAIWQATHPDGWKDPETKEVKKGLESLKDELRPFYKQDKSFWTSLDAEETKKLGYTYADIRETSEETKELFRRRHDWSRRPQNNPENWRPVAPIEMEPLDLSSAQVYVNHPEYLPPTPPPKTQDPPKADPSPKKSEVTKDTKDSRLEDLSGKISQQGDSLNATKLKHWEWFLDDVVER